MHSHLLITLLLTLLLSSLALTAALDEDYAHILEIRDKYPDYIRAVSQLVPTSYTDSRSANTEFRGPSTVGSSNPEATTETTTRTANTQIGPSSGTGSAPPLVTGESRSANTQAVGPSTAAAVVTARPELGQMVMGAVAVGVGMGLVA